MIVKNEAHVITNCFDCVLKYIDYWVICDTGSTDGTQQIILDYFKKHDKPGKLIQHEWYNDFGRSRTLAIQACKGAFSSKNSGLEDTLDLENGYQTFGIKHMTHCDYAFVMDADDTIEGNLVLPDNLNKDSYRFKFGQSQTYYRELLFSLKQDWCYMGVLHEYISCTTKQGFNRYVLEGNYYVVSGRTGGRSQDPKKYLKDAEILVRGIELEKGTRLADRYTFYAGQSYFDYKDYENAIKYYTIASELNGISLEERYYSKYQAAVAKEVLNYPLEDIIKAYTEAYEYNSIRAEPMLRLSIVYSSKKMNQEAYDCILKVKDLKYPPNQFFVVNKLAYDYLVKDQIGVCATRLEKYQEAFDVFSSILSDISLNRIIPDSQRLIFEKKRNIVVGQIKDQTTTYNSLRVSQIKNAMKKNKNSRIILTITTCKRLDLFKKTVNSILNCFDDANIIDNWICIDDNSSTEDRDEMKKLYPFFEFICKPPEGKGHAQSMNIILSRIKAMKAKYLIHLEDDWHFFVKREYIKPAIAIIEQPQNERISLGAGEISQVLFNRNYSEILKDVSIPGGYVDYIKDGIYKDTRFVIHEHHKFGSDGMNDFRKRHPGQGSNAYWPHYSLRPSVLKCDSLLKVGGYNVSAPHFEMEFANRYFEKGFRSAFYDEVNCLHTGRLTTERKTSKDNAYTLNSETQFGIEPVDTPPSTGKDKSENTDYIFFKGMDSHGGDIGYTKQNGSFQELAKVCETTPGCIAFNSLGYLKHSVKDPSQFISLQNPEDGLYVNVKRVSKILENAKLTASSFKLDITFTITTCKRYDLFERTMNHFLQRCKDIDKIKRWICIDDYSSDDDIEKMKKNYPFFEFIFKSKEKGDKGSNKGHASEGSASSVDESNKGHAQSLNKLFDLITTKYVLFFEDDWVCNEDFKISNIHEFLEREEHIQVLMRNANGQHPMIEGASNDGIIYRDYQYNHYHATKPELNIEYDRKNSSPSFKFEPDKQRSFKGWWWPGFTLNPNVFNFEKVKEIIGNKPYFNEEIRSELFEYDFSTKLLEAGAKVAFSNFQIEHIGTETSAYKLNGCGRYYE